MRSVFSLAFAAALAFTGAPSLAQGNAGSMAMPTCPATDPVVWLNTNSKVFHTQGDRYFGHTKSGKFLCQSQAVAAGGHLAKHATGKGTKASTDGMTSGTTSGGSTSSGSMSTGSTSTGSTMGVPSKHGKKHRGGMATAVPATGAPAPSPQSTRLP